MAKRKKDPIDKLMDAFIQFRKDMDKNDPNQRAIYLGVMRTKLGRDSTIKMNKSKKNVSIQPE